LNKEELKALVARLRQNAIGVQESTLDIERQEAMDYYYGRNTRPAPEGRSQIVDRVLMDTVEWIMPQVMRVFASTDEIVKFDPVGPEDEELAEQETAYVNHCIMKKNNGFITLYDAVKDALLLRNGYIKCYWETRKKTYVESYRGLTSDGLKKLLFDYTDQDEEVEVLSQESRKETIEIPTPEGPAQQQIELFDINIRVTCEEGYLCSEAVPPEEIIVAEDAKGSIESLKFIGHLTTKTRTDLLEMGMDEKFVNELPSAGEVDDEGTVAGHRDPIIENDPEAALERSMDDIEYLEAYIRVDYDGDGKAELRKVVLVGAEIPDGDEGIEEIDHIPFTYGVPIRTPHRHVGISLHDLVKDIQDQSSALRRQLFDNVYDTNNQRPVISDKVNLKDLLISKPGAPIRVDTPNGDVTGHLQYRQPTPIVSQLVPVLDMLDLMRENRTGVGRNNTIIDPNVLKQSTDGAQERAFKASNAKIEMIIRLLSETLIKDWVKLAHKTLIKHQEQSAKFKMRGQYVDIDPREWKERDDLSVSVGLGTGSDEEKQMMLTALGGVMTQAAQAGIVLPNNVYNYSNDAAKALGFKQPTRYFTDPSTPQFQQMQKQRAQESMAQEQQQAQMLERAEAVKGQFKLKGDQLKGNLELIKQQNELAFKLKELLQNKDLATAEMEVNAFIEGLNVDLGQPGLGAELGSTPTARSPQS
jgi:hypothetical protein